MVTFDQVFDSPKSTEREEMKKLLCVFVALIVAVLLLPNGAFAQKDAPTASKVPYQTPSWSIKMEFEISDFDVWLKAFVTDEPMRKKVGLIEEKILKNEDNAKVVTVFQVWPSKEKYEAYKAMLEPDWLKRYGLKAEPKVTWYNTIVTTSP
jgi:hypothetical protein